jgi:hypothetical protein
MAQVGLCFPCSSVQNCAVCSGDTGQICNRCKTGFSLSENSCTACPADCSDCSFVGGEQVCLKCK